MKSSVQSWAMRSACDDSDVTFERTDAAVPPASDLLEAMITELTPLYGRIDVPEARASICDKPPKEREDVLGHVDSRTCPVSSSAARRRGHQEVHQFTADPQQRTVTRVGE